MLHTLPTTTAAERHAAATRRADMVDEAEAQRELAELFPHMKLQALRAIQELFPAARNTLPPGWQH